MNEPLAFSGSKICYLPMFQKIFTLKLIPRAIYTYREKLKYRGPRIISMNLILAALYPQRICMNYFPRPHLLLAWKAHYPLINSLMCQQICENKIQLIFYHPISMRGEKSVLKDFREQKVRSINHGIQLTFGRVRAYAFWRLSAI